MSNNANEQMLLVLLMCVRLQWLEYCCVIVWSNIADQFRISNSVTCVAGAKKKFFANAKRKRKGESALPLLSRSRIISPLFPLLSAPATQATNDCFCLFVFYLYCGGRREAYARRVPPFITRNTVWQLRFLIYCKSIMEHEGRHWKSIARRFSGTTERGEVITGATVGDILLRA